MRVYVTRFTRGECVAGTCLMFSLRALRVRVWGFETGLEITARSKA